MDINKLINVVNQLNTKLKDLEQKTAAKQQELVDVDNNIARSQQLLEQKAKKLTDQVEKKLQELNSLDDELLKRKALLSRMNGSNNNQVVEEKPQVSNNNGVEKNGHKLVKEDSPRTNIMENSLEDFISDQFEKEFLVKYPKEPNTTLNERDFDKVLVIIREKMMRTEQPSSIVDDYLSSYSQTLSKEQIDALRRELLPFEKK